MSSPFIGEIRMFAGNFAPNGWAFCDGSLLPISQNDALFNLIGTTYGGDGQSTFALPDLRSRVPVHVGPGFALGQNGGAESVTLTTNQIPVHNHAAQASSQGGNQNSPAGVWAATPSKAYGPGPAGVALQAGAVAAAGGGQPHDNMAPFLAVNYILSLFGIFPSQT